MQETLATREDFYDYGIGREAFAPVVRAIVSVNVASNVMRLGAPAPAPGTPVRLESSTGATLPSPLVADTIYYVIAVDDADDLLRLSATLGGDAISLTDDGSDDAVHSVIVQAGAVIDRHLEATSCLWVEDMVAHAGPVAYGDCPLHVRQGICHEVAGNVVTTKGLLRPGFADPSIPGRAATAREQRAKYRRGMPVDGLGDATPDAGDNAALLIEEDVSASDWANAAGGGVL